MRQESACAVSVVIPHFNRAATLPRALRSVEAQTCRDVEIIVVDDASWQDPAPMIRALSLSLPITILRQEENAGPARCRNLGVAHARGRWIAFLDSDDEWLPEKLACQVAAAERAEDPTRALCVAQTFIQWPDREEARAPWNPSVESIEEFFLLRGGVMQTSSLLLSRELAHSTPFDEGLRQFEDIWLLIQLASRGAQFHFQEQRLFHWRRGGREDQLSSVISTASAARFLELSKGVLGERERRAFLAMMVGPAWIREFPMQFWPAAIGALCAGDMSPRNLAGVVRKSLRLRMLP